MLNACWRSIVLRVFSDLALLIARSTTTTGLGGTLFPPPGSGSATTNIENKNDGKALKETAVPTELFQVCSRIDGLQSKAGIRLVVALSDHKKYEYFNNCGVTHFI
jgi:hypothetical protein